MPDNNIIKTIALFMIIFSIASFARAEDEASSFITARLVRCSQDGAGNAWDDIVMSNAHKSAAIQIRVEWISGVRWREKDVYLKPGEQKIIASDQHNVRDVRVTEAHFK